MEIALRIESSIEPVRSPPDMCTTGTFMCAAAIAPASISPRSPCSSTMSGRTACRTLAASETMDPRARAIAAPLSSAGVALRVVQRPQPVGADPLQARAEFRHEVHAGHDEVQLEAGRARDLP